MSKFEFAMDQLICDSKFDIHPYLEDGTDKVYQITQATCSSYTSTDLHKM